MMETNLLHNILLSSGYTYHSEMNGMDIHLLYVSLTKINIIVRILFKRGLPTFKREGEIVLNITVSVIVPTVIVTNVVVWIYYSK